MASQLPRTLGRPGSNILRDEWSLRTGMKRWQELGLAYGPTFRRVESLRASTIDILAAAKLSSPSEHPDNSPLLHPTTLDASFQVGLAALTKGLCRNFTQRQVPTLIEELEFHHSRGETECIVSCSTKSGAVTIDGVTTDGKPCLRLRGMKLTTLADDSLISEDDKFGAACLKWVPDYDFTDINSLIKIPTSSNHEKQIIEEMALLCIVESRHLLKNLKPSMPHLVNYRAW
ncbi:hypothetical protein ACMFMG_005262 [Clarireedia jacksonii]